MSREPRGNFMSGQWDSLPREQFGCVGGDLYWDKYLYLSDPGKPGVRSMGPDVSPSDTFCET